MGEFRKEAYASYTHAFYESTPISLLDGQVDIRVLCPLRGKVEEGVSRLDEEECGRHTIR